MIHLCHPTLLERFSVTLVGAGGNGSQMLTVLARLHAAMKALGHPGFDVFMYDPDTVSAANIGRQMFSPSDVGLSKAALLVTRVNAFFGTSWRAYQCTWPGPDRGYTSNLVIACVDSRSARRTIARHTMGWFGKSYLLDLGNRAADGQALLGQVGRDVAPHRLPIAARARAVGDTVVDAEVTTDLPSPYTLLPELVAAGAEDDAPSCSLAEALERQELFVNDDVVRAAAQILWQLLRHGRLTWHGAFVNSATGRRTPVPVDAATWERMMGGKP